MFFILLLAVDLPVTLAFSMAHSLLVSQNSCWPQEASSLPRTGCPVIGPLPVSELPFLRCLQDLYYFSTREVFLPDTHSLECVLTSPRHLNTLLQAAAPESGQRISCCVRPEFAFSPSPGRCSLMMTGSCLCFAATTLPVSRFSDPTTQVPQPIRVTSDLQPS